MVKVFVFLLLQTCFNIKTNLSTQGFCWSMSSCHHNHPQYLKTTALVLWIFPFHRRNGHRRSAIGRALLSFLFCSGLYQCISEIPISQVRLPFYNTRLWVCYTSCLFGGPTWVSCMCTWVLLIRSCCLWDCWYRWDWNCVFLQILQKVYLEQMYCLSKYPSSPARVC